MSPANEEFVLAIDLGTSGPKVAVVSEGGSIHGSAVRRVEAFHVAQGGVEQDPEAVWRAVVEASREAIARSSVPPSRVIAAICDSHFFSLVGLDRQLRPTTNVMVWSDRRGRRDLLSQFPGFRPDSLWRQLQWLRIHGIPTTSTGMDNVGKLRWLKLAQPKVYDDTAWFLEPMDYIACRLTGLPRATLCTAFPMQVTDNRRINDPQYSARLLAYAGIDPAKFPPLLPVDGIIGRVLPEVADLMGISSDCQVITGLNDTQAGAVACGAFRGNHAGIVLGSSGVLVTHTRRKKTDIRTALFTIPSPVAGEYLVTAEGGTAGRALEHFLEFIVFSEDGFGRFAADDPYSRLEAVLTASSPGSNGVLFLPWMTGSIAPRPDGHMRGGFLNVGLGTSRADLARAVLEGICFTYHDMAVAARRFDQREFSHFVLYGGGALSDTWSQTMADIVQVPVHRMNQPRLCNCYGLGMLAFQRLGRLSLDDIAARVPIDHVFEPNPALRTLYEEKNAAMSLAFKSNRPVFSRLNRRAGMMEEPQEHE
ncbi:MAG: FGGY-family carbohydrate kinase [Candidatus Hydrogenedentes bacterium]|nr:FGGY-family carbohydrate kinase [Candidatus Hydrogenedentota bacterium]